MKSVRFLPGGVQNVPRSSWAFAVGVSCPSTVTYTPAPVGSLWGCCAFWELYSARAYLCRNVYSSLQKSRLFQGWGGSGSGFSFLKKCRARSVAGLSRGAPVTVFQEKSPFSRGGVLPLVLIRSGFRSSSLAGRIAPASVLGSRYPQAAAPELIQTKQSAPELSGCRSASRFYAVFGVVR